jgi:hypothetical protein
VVYPGEGQARNKLHLKGLDPRRVTFTAILVLDHATLDILLANNLKKTGQSDPLDQPHLLE